LPVTLPPLRLGVGVQRLEARRADRAARALAERELRLASVTQPRLARAGWWNLNARGQFLSAVLGFFSLEPNEPELQLFHRCLDNWRGIGQIVAGMARQGFDLQLTLYDERGWRATFYTTGMEHSPTSATGTGWEHTPWHATQRAAWEALRRAADG